MSTLNLGFATVRLTPCLLLEVTIEYGIDVSEAMVEALCDIVGERRLEHAKLLINCTNDFSFSFKAQQRLFSLDCCFCAIAVVVTTEACRTVLDMARQGLAPERASPVGIFTCPEQAILWLNRIEDRDARPACRPRAASA